MKKLLDLLAIGIYGTVMLGMLLGIAYMVWDVPKILFWMGGAAAFVWAAHRLGLHP